MKIIAMLEHTRAVEALAEVDDAGNDGRWPWRRAVGVSAVLGVVAAGAGFGGWGLERHHRAESAAAVVAPTPAPVKPKPPMPPPEAMLNGQYQATLQDSQSTYVDSSASQWSSGSADYVGYILFSTRCTDTGCVATSTPPSNPFTSETTVETMVWADGEWASRPNPTPDGDGIDHPTTVLYSDGHGGFRGTTTDTIVSGPHAGAQLIAPIVLTPRFDPENL
jgi:hypothetical protein